MSSSDPGSYWYIPEYYLLGQVSKFVQRGAFRVASDEGSTRAITDAAFLNPDGTLVLIAVNQTDAAQSFRVVAQEQQFLATVPDKTVATYRWPSREMNSGAAESVV